MTGSERTSPPVDQQQQFDARSADPSGDHNVVSPEKAREVLEWLRAEQHHNG